MDVVTWTGNGSSPRTISGLNFSPDLVWIKNRTTSGFWNVLFDVIRGGGQLSSNRTDAELAAGSNIAGYVSAYTSNGFTLSAGSSNINTINENGSGIVGWTWDAGSSTVTNTAGSISSQVRANASAGLSIVDATWPSSGAFTIGHGLGVMPSFIISKARTAAFGWTVYHASLGSGKYLDLNTTSAATSNANVWGTHTSSVVSLGSVMASGQSSIMYCFAPVAGYSSFGSYTGNGLTGTSGPFVYCGFRPKYVLIKKSSASDNWKILDSVRDSYNVTEKTLQADLANAELVEAYNKIDILSNGFAIRVTNATFGLNTNDTFIWAAFAESPFQYARAR
jgi:hypothetical protein